MINLLIEENKDYWKKISSKKTTIWLNGKITNFSDSRLLNLIDKISEQKLKSFINSINGNFIIIILKKKYSLVAVDKIRSIPNLTDYFMYLITHTK